MDTTRRVYKNLENKSHMIETLILDEKRELCVGKRERKSLLSSQRASNCSKRARDEAITMLPLRSQTDLLCQVLLAIADDARRSAGYASELLVSPLTVVLICDVFPCTSKVSPDPYLEFCDCGTLLKWDTCDRLAIVQNKKPETTGKSAWTSYGTE
jgi:hypothetical protein